MNQSKIKRDPEGTRRRILLAAAEEFANGGLFGARVDQIARRAETNERPEELSILVPTQSTSQPSLGRTAVLQSAHKEYI